MLAEEKFPAENLEVFDRLSKGLERLTRDGIDAIILDLGLPDSQGIGTFEKMQVAARKVPILILTAFKDDALALEAVRRGAQDYLIKGKIDGTLLVRAVNYAIERKKADEAVYAERKRLFDVLETLPAMICLLTEDYHVAFANRSFRDKFGESSGRLCYEYCWGWSEPCAFCESFMPLKTGKPHHYEVKAPNGMVIDAYDFPFTDVDGTRMVLEMDLDITERKRSETELAKYHDHLEQLVAARTKELRESEQIARQRAEELEQVQQKLEKKAAEVEEYATNMEVLAQERALQLKDAERMATIGQTAGMVGHDIRNPLQAILSELYLAKVELPNIKEMDVRNNLTESINNVEHDINYINKIVQDLQDFAKPLKPASKETDLEDLCEELVAKTPMPNNVQTFCFVEEDAKWIVSDSDILKRVIGNLMTNAVQAMPQGGKLTLRAYREPAATIITVQDTGVGIPEDVRAKLFKPLFTTKSKGQGFGLAVVKRMTESLGGTVSFESELGKGTIFLLEFPQKHKPILSS